MRCRCRCSPDVRPKGWRKVAGELSLDWESAYALRFSGLTPNQRRFLQPALVPFPAHYWRAPDLEPATRHDRLLRWDFANYLPEYVLRKADLCDDGARARVARAAARSQLRRGGAGAAAAARASRRRRRRFLATLAPELERLGAFARKKRGFNPPLEGWLRDDLKDRLPAAAGSLARAHRRPARRRCACSR